MPPDTPKPIRRFNPFRYLGAFSTALILLAGTVMSVFFYMRNRESALYQIRELVVRDAVSMGSRVQANIDAYQRSVAAVQEVVSRASTLNHSGFLSVLHNTLPKENTRGCVFVIQNDKKAGGLRVLMSHGNFTLDFPEGSMLKDSVAAPALVDLLDGALTNQGLAVLTRLPTGPTAKVPVLVVIEPEDKTNNPGNNKGEGRFVVGVYSFNDLVDQALDPTTMHGYDVMAYMESERGQNEVIYFNQANYHDELSPFNLDASQNFATQRYRMPVGDSVAFLAFTPTTEWLSRNESPLPQVVLLFGLSMTCVLATLYVYKSRRASLVQDLVEQRTTELAVANRRLDESRGTFASLLEACPDAINGKDNQGRWTFANRAFLQLAGLPETFPYHGLKDDEIITRAKPANSKFLKLRADLDSQVIYDGLSLRREMTIEVPNHPRRHLDIHMMPVRGTDGGIVGLVAVYNDISELRRRIHALQQSRERVKLLVQNTATAIVEWDEKLKVIHWNPAAARMFGYDAEEIRDKPIAFFADPAAPADSAKALESFLRENDKTIPQVFRHRSRRGHNLTCEWQNTPIIDEEGRPLGVTSFIYDVTERTKAEQALRKRDGILRGLASSAACFLGSDTWETEAAELLRHLVDSLTLSRVCLVRSEVGLNGLEAHTLLEWLNPFWDGTPLILSSGDTTATTRDPHQDVCRAGLHDHLVAHGETFGPCDALPGSWGSMLAAQGTCSVLLLPLRIDNETWGFLRFDDCRTNREWTADEVDAMRVVGAVLAGAIARQILSKEHLQMEKRLLLSQKRESLGLLAGGIARDFNNLINEILGNASLGRTLAETDSSIDSCLASIEEHGLRAAALCHQMQSYSGHGDAQAGLASPNLIILDVINGIDPEHHRRIHFRKDLANGIPILEVDVDQIRQAIQAIVNNALEAIGNLSGLVEIQTRPAHPSAGMGEGAEITIRDTGTGMTPQVRDRMFDPFFSTKMTGRGLGLTIAQSIIEAHGGTIAVESSSGKGTLVKVLLPSRPTRPELASPVQTQSTMSGNVLVVHDGRPTGHATALAFQQLGFATESCLGVDHAMQNLIAYPDRYCLVAVDPHASGAEAATLQRLRLACANAAVILLTDSEHCPAGLRHFADEGLAVLLPGDLSAESLRGAVATALKFR